MRTVKVRIAVAIDPKGNWNACGGQGMPDDESMSLAVDAVADGEARYFLEADLAIPEAPTIQAKVEKP